MNFQVGDEVILLETGRGWFGKYTGSLAKVSKIYFDRDIAYVILYDGREIVAALHWLGDAKYCKTDLWKKLEGDDDS